MQRLYKKKNKLISIEFLKNININLYKFYIQLLVRLLALCQIKPHAPPLVRTSVNSFEFQPCDRTPQVVHLRVSYDSY